MHVLETTETIHVYYEREEEPKPFTVLPLLCALLCLLGVAAVTLYSADHPSYERARLLVPAVVLPPQTCTAHVQIIPTGIKTYPATTAHGTLTITNGSVIAQIVPAVFTSVSNTGVSVVTDRAIFVPAGNANGYGVATVSAHALIPGKGGNFARLAINQVIGSSVYIRNLSAFTGGHDAYSVKYVTAQDTLTALLQARSILLSKSSGLHYPCREFVRPSVVTWQCQFVRYTVPSYMHVSSVQLRGNQLILSVWYIPRAQPVRLK